MATKKPAPGKTKPRTQEEMEKWQYGKVLTAAERKQLKESTAVEREMQEQAARQRAAADCAMYTTIWIREKDPEFYPQLIGKNFIQAIPLINAHYGLHLSRKGIKPSEYIYELANAVERKTQARVMSKRVAAYRKKQAAANKRKAERVKKAEEARKAAAAEKKKATKKPISKKVH